MTETKTVQLGGQEVTLALPASYALRTEAWLLASDNRTRGLAAALGFAWRGKGRPTVNYQVCQFNPAVYGARVLDELIERGLSLTDILRAGGVALEMMTGSMASESEVVEAEGNSDAGEDSTA